MRPLVPLRIVFISDDRARISNSEYLGIVPGNSEEGACRDREVFINPLYIHCSKKRPLKNKFQRPFSTG